MKQVLLFILCVSILFGCSKAKRSGWIVADIQVVNGYTGEPIEANIYLSYWSSAGLGQAQENSIAFGQVDEFGRMHIERKVRWKESSFKINIPVGHFFGATPGEIYFKEYGLGLKSKNQLFIELLPKSAIVLNLKNVNCTAPTDTMWLTYSSGYQHVFIGCADTLLLNPYGYSLMVDNPAVTFDITTKKSGVLNSYSESF
jgi:hypothetical protein